MLNLFFEEDKNPNEIDTLEQEKTDNELLGENIEKLKLKEHLEEVEAYLSFNEAENETFGIRIGFCSEFKNSRENDLTR